MVDRTEKRTQNTTTALSLSICAGVCICLTSLPPTGTERDGRGEDGGAAGDSPHAAPPDTPETGAAHTAAVSGWMGGCVLHTQQGES
jgi:hypothetical protein